MLKRLSDPTTTSRSGLSALIRRPISFSPSTTLRACGSPSGEPNRTCDVANAPTSSAIGIHQRPIRFNTNEAGGDRIGRHELMHLQNGMQAGAGQGLLTPAVESGTRIGR